jgi:peptide chain release factor 2
MRVRSCLKSVPRPIPPRILTDIVSRRGVLPSWTRCKERSWHSASGQISSGCVFDYANEERELADLEIQSGIDGFWNDAETAQRVMRRIGEIRARLEQWQDLDRSVNDLSELVELAEDDDLEDDFRQELSRLTAIADDIELAAAFSGPHDRSNALIMVHSGEGGIDSQDFAEMILRMYVKWADRRGFKAEVLETTPGEEAGIKNGTIEISGTNAYGYAKGEAGSHRLVRLSPFDSAHRRHTSFALVEVLPEIESDNEIDLKMDDVRVDTYRASGAGGQHVNKTSSAIRLTHIPTGIVVTCQNERSQMQNRETAFKILRARLLERKMNEELDEKKQLKGEHTNAGFGNRIRSYVLHPYTMVTDHRTDTSVSDAQGVLNGDIEVFTDAYLKAQLGQPQPA